MATIIATYSPIEEFVNGSIFVTTNGTIFSENSYGMRNWSGPSVNPGAFARIDGSVLAANDIGIDFRTLAGQAGFNRVVVGDTGNVQGGVNSAAISLAGVGSSIENRGDIAGGVGVGMTDAGLGHFTNHGSVSGLTATGLSIFGSSTVDVLNTGTLSGTTAIVIDSSAAVISNTGTLFGHAGTAIDVANGPASIVFDNLGDVFGNITVSGSLSFSDNITNDGTIRGYVDLGGGNDSFLGRGGTVTGLVFGQAGDDLLVTGQGDENLLGGDGIDTLRGGAGDDTLDGGTGNDTLQGQDGEDDLYGGSGRDRLLGGRGDDTLTGGASQDHFAFARGGDDDRVTDFADGTDRIDLSAFDFANAAAALALMSNRSGGVLLDLTDAGGGTVLVAGITVAQISAADLVL